MVATAGPRYAQPHQTIEYPGGIQQCSQQPSSAGSSNGNSSNGHNSQPATPGPQPIASPAQVFVSCANFAHRPDLLDFMRGLGFLVLIDVLVFYEFHHVNG
uniref:Uncharacterized protein n=1 Tax=Parascaris equorum TaxID=6256 RepID=A0A914RD68_PAREQ